MVYKVIEWVVIAGCIIAGAVISNNLRRRNIRRECIHEYMESIGFEYDEWTINSSECSRSTDYVYSRGDESVSESDLLKMSADEIHQKYKKL